MKPIHLDIPNVLLGAIVPLMIAALYQWVFKKILYFKLIGEFYHGTDNENRVKISHVYGERFTITEEKSGIEQWRGVYQRQAKGLLVGVFDLKSGNFEWGKHSLHLHPDNTKISVLIEPLVPQQASHAIEWLRKK